MKRLILGETAWGRPVAVLVMPDGSLPLSSDHARAIRRVVYRGPGLAAPWHFLALGVSSPC